MALHRLLSIDVGVPDPSMLDDFYQEIGFTGSAGSWGAIDQPGQIRVVEAPYRQLREMRLGCEHESDLDATALRLDELGVKSQRSDGKLRVTDPINFWDIVIEPAPAFEVTEQPEYIRNRPGVRPRVDRRADIITEKQPRPPRRLGHVVVGTPDPIKAREFYADGIGYRISDTVLGVATFMRCSPDHHNLLLAPGPVPYLNHYAIEHDDQDAVARAATLYLRKHGDERHLSGLGRHQIGGNVFWYLIDPSGTFFEFFADMDRILDDEAWEIGTWAAEDTWSLWGPKEPPEIFFNPSDMPAIVEGFKRERR